MSLGPKAKAQNKTSRQKRIAVEVWLRRGEAEQFVEGVAA